MSETKPTVSAIQIGSGETLTADTSIITINENFADVERMVRILFIDELDERAKDSIIQSDEEYAADPTHTDAHGMLLARPIPPAVEPMPAAAAAQAVWTNNKIIRKAMQTVPLLLEQAVKAYMGVIYTKEWRNSPFNVVGANSQYPHMKRFLRWKFGDQLKPTALAAGKKNLNAKLPPGGDIFAHNSAHRASERAYTSLRGAPQAPPDQYDTYSGTLSSNPQAMHILNHVYQGGIHREGDHTFVDPNERTVESAMRALELHYPAIMATSTPFAAGVTVTTDESAAYAAGLAAGIAKSNTSQRPQRSARNPPAAAPAVPRPVPPTVPYKAGTVYCYWCGYYVPGSTYYWRKHSVAHTSATCPCLADAAWVAKHHPTAAQKAAGNHNVVAGGKYSGEENARA